MNRDQLEHLIRAAAVIAADSEIVVFGSQAILGQFPDAPESMRVSVEADLFPLHHPERADVIDGSIGELSPFHETFGYYAHGVAEETARLPVAWRERLVVVENANTGRFTISWSQRRSPDEKRTSPFCRRQRSSGWRTLRLFSVVCRQ